MRKTNETRTWLVNRACEPRAGLDNETDLVESVAAFHSRAGEFYDL